MKPVSSATTSGGVPSLLAALGLDGEGGRMDWLDQAVCGQTDPEAFFPEQGGSNAAARRTCMECDVRVQCLEWAIEMGEENGIWGGMTKDERREYARRTGLDYGAAAADLRQLMPSNPRPRLEDGQDDELAA